MYRTLNQRVWYKPNKKDEPRESKSQKSIRQRTKAAAAMVGREEECKQTKRSCATLVVETGGEWRVVVIRMAGSLRLLFHSMAHLSLEAVTTRELSVLQPPPRTGDLWPVSEVPCPWYLEKGSLISRAVQSSEQVSKREPSPEKFNVEIGPDAIIVDSIADLQWRALSAPEPQGMAQTRTYLHANTLKKWGK